MNIDLRLNYDIDSPENRDAEPLIDEIIVEEAHGMAARVKERLEAGGAVNVTVRAD